MATCRLPPSSSPLPPGGEVSAGEQGQVGSTGDGSGPAGATRADVRLELGLSEGKGRPSVLKPAQTGERCSKAGLQKPKRKLPFMFTTT